MPALQCNITIEQGATFQREFTVTYRGEDLPGFQLYAARGMVRDRGGALVAVFTVQITGPRTVLVSLTAAQTTLLPVSATDKYDVEVESPEGVVYRIAEGRVRISEEQTR